MILWPQARRTISIRVVQVTAKRTTTCQKRGLCCRRDVMRPPALVKSAAKALGVLGVGNHQLAGFAESCGRTAIGEVPSV